MIGKTLSAALRGIDAFLVEVEADVQLGMPAYRTVGLPETAVKESKERVRGAILNSGYSYPVEVITINLAPAEMPKEGTQLDLSIAVAMLASTKQIPSKKFRTTLL